MQKQLAEENEYLNRYEWKNYDELDQCPLLVLLVLQNFNQEHGHKLLQDYDEGHKLLQDYDEGHIEVMSRENQQAQLLNSGLGAQQLGLDAEQLGMEPEQLGLELQLGAKVLASKLSEACSDITGEFVNELTLSQIVALRKTLEQLNESSPLL